MMKMCIIEQVVKVLESCHSSPFHGNHRGKQIVHNLLQSCFLWPTLFKNVFLFVKVYD